MKRLFISEIYKFRKSKKNFLLLLVCLIYSFGIGFSFAKQDENYNFQQSVDFEYDYMMTNEDKEAANAQYELLVAQGIEGEELQNAFEKKELWFKINDSNRTIQLTYLMLARLPNSEVDFMETLYSNRSKRMEAMLEAKETGLIVNTLSFRNANVDDYKKELQLSQYLSAYTAGLREQGLFTYNSPYYMSGLNFLIQVIGGTGSILFAVCILLTQENYALEMSSGTYKTSMSIPSSRKQIIFAKLLSSLATGFFFLLVAIGIPFLYFTFMYGLGDFNYPYWISDGLINTTIPYLLKEYGIYLFYILFLLSSTLLCSVLFQSLSTTFMIKASEIVGAIVLFGLLSTHFQIMTWIPIFHIQPALSLQLLENHSVLQILGTSFIISIFCLTLTVVRFQTLDLQQKED